MEKRVARFNKLQTYQQQNFSAHGIPPGAVEKITARRVYPVTNANNTPQATLKLALGAGKNAGAQGLCVAAAPLTFVKRHEAGEPRRHVDANRA